MKKIINESIYDFKTIRPVAADKEFTFTGDPSQVELTKIAGEIVDAIITVAARGDVYVNTANKDQKGPYRIKLAKDDTRTIVFTASECVVEVLGENYNSQRFPTRPFEIRNLLKGTDYTFGIRQGNKVVKDTERIEKIQALVNTYFKLKAELDEFLRPEREAQELKRQRRAIAHNRGITDEERLIQQLDLAIPGNVDEQQKAILWLAAHVGTISAQVKESLVRAFGKYLDIDPLNTPSVSVVKDGTTLNGVIRKYSWSLEASLIGVTDLTQIPSYFKQYDLLSLDKTKITASNFVAKLVRDYDFTFGKYTKQSRDQLFKKLLKDFDLVDAEAEATNAPLDQEFPEPTETTDVE
jgi:hypothetical protein